MEDLSSKFADFVDTICNLRVKNERKFWRLMTRDHEPCTAHGPVSDKTLIYLVLFEDAVSSGEDKCCTISRISKAHPQEKVTPAPPCP